MASRSPTSSRACQISSEERVPSTSMFSRTEPCHRKGSCVTILQSHSVSVSTAAWRQARPTTWNPSILPTLSWRDRRHQSGSVRNYVWLLGRERAALSISLTQICTNVISSFTWSQHTTGIYRPQIPSFCPPCKSKDRCFRAGGSSALKSIVSIYDNTITNHSNTYE